MSIHQPSLLYLFDRAIAAEIAGTIVGVDEVGRGPLAGPVLAAAVILDLDAEIPGINDSKKLLPAKREKLHTLITASALAWAVGEATVAEIEEHNILQATFIAMRRALEGISHQWGLLLVDGNQKIAGIPGARQRTIVKGDGKSASIAAASIVAKVTRDRIVDGYHECYPQYHFPHHKGYGTEEHRKSIIENGLCEHHRPSFCERILSE